jgi:hypothetical protein
MSTREAPSDRPATYAAAGVSIEAGNRLVQMIAPLVRATSRPGADATTADVIQLWLDGDATEAIARQENNTAVEFWMRVGTDVEPMRHAKAPAQLVANVMAAIPVKEPSAIKQAPLAD